MIEASVSAGLSSADVERALNDEPCFFVDEPGAGGNAFDALMPAAGTVLPCGPQIGRRVRANPTNVLRCD